MSFVAEGMERIQGIVAFAPGVTVRAWGPVGLVLWTVAVLGVFVPAGAGQEEGEPPEFSALNLKSIPLEQLVELEVTSVSRRAEPFLEAPSAIDVISQEEIERSGSRSIMDALRLAAGLHVAQSDGRTWGISARGFNLTTANKMQVLMDGRSLYSPLFSGVFWDVQDTMLEDIDRIEVIRGPGATLWGANAVNGVINIITKEARHTQGTLVTAGGGTYERAFGGVRYGGQLGENTHYRVYAKHFQRDSLVFPDGSEGDDDWQMSRTGFRVDSDLTDETLLTVQGDLYYGRLDDAVRDDTEVSGGNVLSRWTRRYSEESELQFQVYYDRTARRVPGQFEELRDTVDVELQHSVGWTDRMHWVWGLNYRISSDDIENSEAIKWVPEDRAVQLYSAFIQDTIYLVPDRLTLTLGSKFEYHTMGGFEVQPSGRLAWTPHERHTLWGAVSRAVRAPTRIDEDFRVFLAPGFLALRGSGSFDSEKVVAYEMGYRVQPFSRLSVDLATFYNVYEDLRTTEQPGGAFPIFLENRLDATTYGAEFVLRYHLSDWWRLKGSYTYLQKDLDLESGSSDTSGGMGEGNDPHHMFSVYSFIDLGKSVSFDQVLRFVDTLPEPHVPSYLVLDLRLAWRPVTNLELAVVGRNLLDNQHPEFGSEPTRREIEHSVYGKVTWRY